MISSQMCSNQYSAKYLKRLLCRSLEFGVQLSPFRFSALLTIAHFKVRTYKDCPFFWRLTFHKSFEEPVYKLDFEAESIILPGATIPH